MCARGIPKVIKKRWLRAFYRSHICIPFDVALISKLVSNIQVDILTVRARNCKCACLKDSGVQSRAGNKVPSCFDVLPTLFPSSSHSSPRHRPPFPEFNQTPHTWEPSGRFNSNELSSPTKLVTVGLSSAGTPVYFANTKRNLHVNWGKGVGRDRGPRPRRVKRLGGVVRACFFFKPFVSD